MARTLQTARLSTGGKAPRKQTAVKRGPRKQLATKTNDDSAARNSRDTIVVTSAELIPRVPNNRRPDVRRSARIRAKHGDQDSTSSSSSTSTQPFYPTIQQRPFLPFARFDDDPELLSSIQDMQVPLLSNAVWQPHSNGDPLRGGFGYVERASWNKQQVAVKFLKSSQTVSGVTRGKKSFRRELAAWKELEHPNILPFIGVVCVDKMYLGMVSPYMANGSAPKYLADHPEANIVQILLDVANGMSHLAAQTPPIAHGDLKGANVLIDNNGRACICDFGLSRFMKDFMSIDTTFGGTIRWMAPEQLRAESMIVSLSADIFSWGMLALELMTGTIPWPEVQQDSAVILKVAARGQRPSRPECECSGMCGCLAGNNRLWALIEWCWRDDPGDRPDIERLFGELGGLRTLSV